MYAYKRGSTRSLAQRKPTGFVKPVTSRSGEAEEVEGVPSAEPLQ